MKKNILDQVKKNKTEDIGLLRDIEKILVKKRGYVFKMPKPGSKVISLLSGGVDTTIVTALLLDKYQLEVYPIHYQRPWPAADTQEMLKCAQYFGRYFKKRYPKRCHDLITIPMEFPSQSIFLHTTKYGHKIVNEKTGQRQGTPFQPNVFVYNAVNYVHTLSDREQKDIRNIFLASLATNCIYFAYESLTSYRCLNLEMCTMLNDFSWQCSCLPMETELGFYLDKAELIKMAAYLNLPLEKTRTCQLDMPHNCGACITCYSRKEGFRDAGVIDKTIYENERKDFFGRLFGKYLVNQCLKRNHKYFNRL